MKCLHCESDIASKKKEFCCVGCQYAYKFVSKLNLQKYYKYCSELYSTTPQTVTVFENNFIYTDSIIDNQGDEKKIYLAVEGIFCGACVWLIENSLEKQANVISARVNMSTKRLTLVWKGDVEQIDQYVHLIHNLGYKLIPYDSAQENQHLNEEKKILRYIAIAGGAFAQSMMIAIAIWAGSLGSNNIGNYTRLMLHIVSGLIVLPAIIYCGQPFFKSAWVALKHKTTNMDVPISIAILSAILISLQEVVREQVYTYFDSAIMLVFALLIGRYLSLKAKNQAQNAAYKLVLSQPLSATLVKVDKLCLVNIKDIKVGDIVLVTNGEKIPVDGVLLDKACEVDTSVITGELTPKLVNQNDYLYAGTVNVSAAIKVEVQKIGEQTIISEIIKLLENAGQKKSKYQMLSDRVSKIYTPFVLTIAIITYLWWINIEGIESSQALLYAVSVLIITCPCALGLAVPVAQVITSMRLMSKGVLLKTQDALEKLSNIQSAIFDKTGTITSGRPSLIQQNTSKEKMQIIATMASHSKHPLCKAIYNSFTGEILSFDVVEHKGMGLLGNFNGEEVKLGNREFCGIDENINDEYMECWFLCGNNKPLRLLFADSLRQGSAEMVAYFKNHCQDVLILSGDRENVVKKMALNLQVDYRAECTPEEKYTYLEYNKDNKVMMVGDGLNDAAALKMAYVSASHSEAIDITQNSADIIFQNDIKSLVFAHKISKRANKVMKQNIAMSFVYNVVTIPIAMMGLVIPIIAAITMSLSSIMVVLNSCRINKD